MHPINLNWPHYIQRYISQGKDDCSSHQPQREGINLKYFPAQRQLSSFLISRSISDDCFLACEAKNWATETGSHQMETLSDSAGTQNDSSETQI